MKNKKYMNENYPGLHEFISKFNEKYSNYHLCFRRYQPGRNRKNNKDSSKLEDKIANMIECFPYQFDGDALYLLKVFGRGAESAYVINEDGYRIYQDGADGTEYIDATTIALVETIRQVFANSRPGHLSPGIETWIAQNKERLEIKNL